MRTFLTNHKALPFLLGLGFILAACGVRQSPFASSNFPSNTPLSDAPDPANGKQIYFTATSERSGQIGYQGGPDSGGMMMGSYLTCAACHGSNARGGKHTMHMTVMDAPDIRISALASESEEHGGTDGHDEYSLETFRKAVVQGQHPDGDALSQDMPRWQMSDADLADLFAFLQTLP